MKIKLTLLLLVSLSITTFAQDLTVTFSNARNTNDGTDDFYEADIVVSSATGFKLGDGQLYFDYNTAAFGTNVVATGNFEFVIPDGAILALPGGFGLFYNTNFVDNTDQVVSTNYSAQGSAGAISGNNITGTPTVLFSIKIKYEDAAQDPGVSFNTVINGATEQFFTACGPFDTAANKDCTNFPGDQITSENATFDSTGAEISSDTTPPVITLTGNPTVTVEAGTTYTDDGATASDDTDGDITAAIVIVNPVDTSLPGVYTVTYNVSDAAGNVATVVTREVTVADTTIPVISLIGNASVTVEAGTSYNDAGATASDSLDGDITAAIVIVNPVDTAVPGVYTVTYNVSDAAGNAATQVTREVTVEDTTAPVISILGDNPVEIALGDVYTDAGATAFDSFDGDITPAIVVVNPVDTSAEGTYTVTYNVIDASGNAATEVTRTVNVSQVLSIEDNSIEGLEVYPNPVTHTVKITLPVESVVLYNSAAQKVLETTHNEIDMGSIPNGVYFLHIFTGQGNDVKRILKN